MSAGDRPDNGADCRVVPSFEAQHRALVQERVRANHLSIILRGGLHKLTRAGAPLLLSQVVSEMMDAALSVPEDVPTLVSNYSKTPVRKIIPRMSVYHSRKESHRIC